MIFLGFSPIDLLTCLSGTKGILSREKNVVCSFFFFGQHVVCSLSIQVSSVSFFEKRKIILTD